ncbi:hypothetical protein DFS34DRAFT_600186 [Phlyctochytrium arcticum]|nr:hypothetical protein DFS34DRAFT_600186 [Phlyctochytrium arcticum]
MSDLDARRDTPSERSPLLGNAPVRENDLASEDSAHASILAQLRSRLPTHKTPTRKTILLSVMAFLIMSTKIILPIIYLVIIPKQLETALNGNMADIKSLTIQKIGPSGVMIGVEAEAVNEQVPPVDVTLHPTVFSFLHWKDPSQELRNEERGDQNRRDDGTLRIGTMQFPGVSVPRGAKTVPISFESMVTNLDIPFLKEFVHRLVKSQRKGPLPPQMFNLQADPLVALHHVGSWVVPMHSDILFDQSQVPEPDMEQYNLTVTDYSVTPTPSGNPLGSVSVTASFNNPTQFSLRAQDFGFQFSIYNDGVAIATVKFPREMHIDQGLNTNFKLRVDTISENVTTLMKLICKYSEGSNTTLVLKDFGLDYADGKSGSVPWVEEVLEELNFVVEVPGKDREDDGDDGDDPCDGGAELLGKIFAESGADGLIKKLSGQHRLGKLFKKHATVARAAVVLKAAGLARRLVGSHL